jgi:protein sidekick
LNVSWSTPEPDFVNGRLLAYKLIYFNNDFLANYVGASADEPYDDESDDELAYYSSSKPIEDEKSEFELINVVIVEPELNNIIINNLKPFKNYTCFIKLINQAGDSNDLKFMLSSILLTNTAQTFESIPSTPASLTFGYVSYTFLNVSWLRPLESNGLILAYELWYENMPSDQSLGLGKTKIIRQEIQAQPNVSNYTFFISNLEPSVEYKFRVRCRTQIDWGSYVERVVRTGPQLKKYAKSGAETQLAPLAPSKPAYTNINETHALLEWKAYSNEYDLFIVEFKFVSLDNQTSANEAFELFGYANATSLLINKYDKKLNQKVSSSGLSSSAPGLIGTPLTASSFISPFTLCVFRVYSFGSVSISEPSPSSELVHISKTGAMPSSNQASFLDKSFEQFYNNWWFLVIVALASLTLLIIIILVMFVRGKNKKFLLNRKKRNTMRMMKLNPNNQTVNSQSTNQQATWVVIKFLFLCFFFYLNRLIM